MTTEAMIGQIKCGAYDSRLQELYVDDSKLERQRMRYIRGLETYRELFGEGEVEIYSAPGRSEVGGNHTDHQHGEILAASINLDVIGIVHKTDDRKVTVRSDGYPAMTLMADDLQIREAEKGTTVSLIRGVLAGMVRHGYRTGGFQAYITSEVLVGAGLSSSAAYETLLGNVLSGLYNERRIPAEEIAMIGQYAENVYFGKPCGLMDQMACSVGNLVHVDFAKPQAPIVEKLDFDLNRYGYSLCITDTKGSHADLTAEYAAIPTEMKYVAGFFGQEVLLGLTEEKLLENIGALREKTGDRAVLRALHFIWENERVGQEVKALREGDCRKFLELVKASGDSSYKYLQNVYTQDTQHQNVALALAISEEFLGENGVCRVHGGGFAGTIQAFVKNEVVAGYRKRMDLVFGEGACNVLKIRQYGGACVTENTDGMCLDHIGCGKL